MESQKTTSRTSLLNMMLLKAWKERWTDAQWGINIKTVLPRGVSGDVYNLADCILQQAVIGSSANPLFLSYLKHSLCAHLISHAAVLKRISKYDHFDKVYCVTSLLEFLETIMDGVTCRSKPEESVLPSSMLSLVYWLMQIFLSVLESYEVNGQLTTEQHTLLDKTMQLIDKIAKNDFFLGMLFIGKQEDIELSTKLTDKYSELKNSLTLSGFVPDNSKIDDHLHLLAYLDVNQIDMIHLDLINTEPVTYSIQPMLALIILLNPSSDTQVYVNELLMIQRLKNYSRSRLFYEIIRAGFISLSSVIETTHDTIWGALTFIKVPQILKQLNSLSQSVHNENLDYIPDVVDAFEMLLEDSSLLDFMDAKCYCNTVEYLLNDWAKQHLVNERHIKHFSSKRESIQSLMQRREVNNQAPSIINLVLRAEVPLSGILKTLSSEYSKVQEALLGMLCQVLVGNSFELILSVATVEGRLKTFVSRLIKCNENSKQVPGELGQNAMVRSTLFDVSFLMLTFIVQIYGSDAVLPENGDSFFEKWVRECMVERNKTKSPKKMVALCDESIVDELLLTLSKPDAQLKNSLSWQDICMNIPGVLYQVLVAWENDTLSSTDVKGILDNIKMRLFSFSVCAASYLCAYMQTVRENEFLKPINMVLQFLSTLTVDEMSSQDNIKERLGLTYQIIRKMQHDIHPTGNVKPRAALTLTLTQNLVSQTPLEEQFREVWKNISDRAWLPIKSAQILESLLQACGPVWLVTNLVDEILKCRFTRDMTKTMDIVFAVMHLDIERNTIALLDNLLSTLIFNKNQKHINEPQSAILAKLCVYCIISNLESPYIRSPGNGNGNKKRSRTDTDDIENSNAAKLRKLGAENSTSGNNSGDSSSNDFFSENTINNKEQPSVALREPLQICLQRMFKIFANSVQTDELSLKIYFIFQFISFLIECGKDRVRPILKLIPNNLIQNLLKVMMTDEISVGLISRLYDLRSIQGRQSAVSDLCLLRNIEIRKNNIEL